MPTCLRKVRRKPREQLCVLLLPNLLLSLSIGVQGSCILTILRRFRRRLRVRVTGPSALSQASDAEAQNPT